METIAKMARIPLSKDILDVPLISACQVREGKNQEDRLRSEMDLLREPDASGLLADLLCTPMCQVKCVFRVSIVIGI